MAVRKFDRFFKDVPAGSVEEKHYVPLDGETLNITIAYGEASLSPETLVCMYWDMGGVDEMLLFATHSSNTDENINFTVVGDGVKKLTMCLRNNQLTSDVLGMGWRD